MSFVMEIRKCPACGKKYNWTPSVIACPHCLGFGNVDKPKAQMVCLEKRRMSPLITNFCIC